MFEGLYLYEIVLLVLGIVLFGLLVVVLVVYVSQKRGLTALLPFFMMPVLMIGFPAFQKIRFADGQLELEKRTRKVAENPGDEKARAELKASLERVASRPTSDPKANLTAARAYKALGQPERALAKVDSALRLNPRLSEAARLKAELERETQPGRPPR